jgi:hypothetical protein
MMCSAKVWLSGVCLLLASRAIAADAVIVVAADASPLVRLAAREVNRYVYVRTGERLPVRPAAAAGRDSIRLLIDKGLGAQAYRMRTAGTAATGRTLTLAGGGDVAVLYAAYHFAETLGVRFYLHGDVLPDQRIPFVLPNLDETHTPLFETRGILPFHDFTEGPDWWEEDDYKAYLTQMVKMRMNLLNLHCYPEGAAGPEPLVWIGHPDDVDARGKVAFSPPSRWASTNYHSWGHAPMPTSGFAAGASRLFEEDDFGPSVTRGHRPEPASPAASNEVFERTSGMLRGAFGYGRRLGVGICLGTEAPLTIPRAVQARLREKGLNPESPDVRQKIYEGMFARIARAYPIDHYLLWTPEVWTWRGATQPEIDATANDIKTALAALKAQGNPFGFGTSGWELGPKQDRGLFDNLLPKDAVMSCINRNIGFNWVDQEFVRIKNRPRWAIPWMEDDSAMVLPQLWAGRMRRDAADALAYGCSGLLGIHWRTKILAPNVSALAKAAWSQDGWNPDAGKPAAEQAPTGELPPLPKRKRDLPCADFYTDLSAAWFGPGVAAEMASFLTRYDGDNGAYDVIQGRATLPRPNTWLYGPGAIVANPGPWAEAAQRYTFVDDLTALRQRVNGAGNRDRFDYWLNSFRHLRAVDEAACARGALDIAMERVKAEKDATRRKELARTGALPARIRLARTWETMMTWLLVATDTPGELGTIANLELATRGKLQFVNGHDTALAEALGEPALPASTKVSSRYQGEPRIIVPTQRSVVSKGETPTLKVIVLDNEDPAEAVLCWRALGAGEFRGLPLRHVARGVYQVILPAVPDEGAEYYLRVMTAAGKPLVWPATAPGQNFTIVQLP